MEKTKKTNCCTWGKVVESSPHNDCKDDHKHFLRYNQVAVLIHGVPVKTSNKDIVAIYFLPVLHYELHYLAFAVICSCLRKIFTQM